jgi:uncharacterized protein YggE
MKNSILLAVFVIGSAFLSGQVSAEVIRMVSVRGEGEVSTKPDMADITLQVSSKAKDAKTAQSKNAKEMARVEKVLKDQFKIESKEIQTSHFQVNPEYNYDQNGKRSFLGFRADHGLMVNVKKIDQLGAILDALIGKGSEDLSVQLNGINFGSSKRKELELKALEGAMQSAQLRAEALAGYAKKKIRGVLRITDSRLGYAPPPMLGGIMQMKAADVQMESTQISTGEVKIQANVSVEYEID